MKYDIFGVPHTSARDVCEILYENPGINLSTLLVDDPEIYNFNVKSTYAGFDYLVKYVLSDEKSVSTFDLKNQAVWHMPKEYATMDIAKWVLDQCKCEAELQRAAEELFLFQDCNLFNLLRYMKYMVDTFRKNNVVWGLGRGSSVASFVLYLIGVHKINSLHYNIPINEFFKTSKGVDNE